MITALVKQQNGLESYSLDYHLGWPRRLGEPKQPDFKVHYSSGFDNLPKGMKIPETGDDDEIKF